MPVFGYMRVFIVDGTVYIEAPDQETADQREEAMSDLLFWDYAARDNPLQRGITESLGEMDDSIADFDEEYFADFESEEDDEEAEEE